MKKEYLYRAMYFTMELIEKEEKVNDHLSELRIERYKRELEEMKNMVLEIENA